MNIAGKVTNERVIVSPYMDDTYMNVLAVACGDSFAKHFSNYLRGDISEPKHFLVNVYSQLVRELLSECNLIGNTIYLIQVVNESKDLLLVHRISTYKAIKALAKGNLFDEVEKALDRRGESCKVLTYHLEKDLITNL